MEDMVRSEQNEFKINRIVCLNAELECVVSISAEAYHSALGNLNEFSNRKLHIRRVERFHLFFERLIIGWIWTRSCISDRTQRRFERSRFKWMMIEAARASFLFTARKLVLPLVAAIFFRVFRVSFKIKGRADFLSFIKQNQKKKRRKKKESEQKMREK